MKKLIWLILPLPFFCVAKPSWATTAASCSQANVETAISETSAGGVVIIPEGDCTWDTNITVNKDLTIQGQTTTSRDSSTFVVTPTDRTIIRERGFTITATTVRVTGITFDDYTYNLGTGHVLFILPDPIVSIIIDHCSFRTGVKLWNPKGNRQYSMVIHNNLFLDPGYEMFYVLGRGNIEWSEGGLCGSSDPEKAVWIEDNEFRLTVDWVSGQTGRNIIDAGDGARLVVRKNLFTGGANTKWEANILESHGHCWIYRDSDDNAGTYCMEVSDNKIYSPTTTNVGQGFFAPRGGRNIVYGNIITTENGLNLGLAFRAEEAVLACNTSTPCAVADHYNTGLALNYHTIPLTDDPHYQSPEDKLCTSWPCTPMQVMNSYVFKNTKNGGDITVGTNAGGEDFIQRNRDWWDDINGVFSEGTSLPGTCTVHDLYWNTSTKVLNRCTSTDTWTTVYTASTYPHPLRDDAPDTTAPADPTYAINVAGSSFTVTFSEAVTHGAGGTTGWVLTSDGGAVTATYSSGAASTSLVYQLSRTVYSTETITGTYTQPASPGITDIAGNLFASVTDVAITNSSEATAGAPTYPKMTLSTGSNVTLSPSGTGSFTLAP